MLHKPITPTKAWLLYVCLLTLMAGCSKCNKVIEPANELAKLPAATQTGAGTFGCMLNGQAWLPVRQGRPLEMSNPSMEYDETFEGGAFGASATIFINGISQEKIAFSCRNVNSLREYNLTNSDIVLAYYGVNDAYYSDEDIASNCKLIITKLDKTNKIIAGTFSFTIQKKDTGKTVTVTDGRFDLKYL